MLLDIDISEQRFVNMTVRQSGIWCDVCNKPKPLEPTTVMKITGVSPETMHCCDECKPSMDKWNETRDTNYMPEGPLKDMFEKAILASES